MVEIEKIKSKYKITDAELQQIREKAHDYNIPERVAYNSVKILMNTRGNKIETFTNAEIKEIHNKEAQEFLEEVKKILFPDEKIYFVV